MGKRRCFLGFLVSLFVFVFSANSFAEGYTCEKEYTSCANGYYLESGNCLSCQNATNTTTTQSCVLTCSVENGDCTCSNSGTQQCAGNYTGGNGTGGSGGAAAQCTGCSEYASACSGTCTKQITCHANYEYSDGECVACSTKNTTQTENITGGTRSRSVTYSSTAGGTCTPSYGDWSYSCNANYEYSDGECVACSTKNTTQTEDITGGTRSRSVTYSSTAGGTCTPSYGDWVPNCTETGYHANGESCASNTFNVNYANGGGTGSGPTSPTSCTYGGTCNAPSNTYTRNGYDFTGWSCTASSGQCAKSSYAAGESISTATSVNGATITLTATWSENAGNCSNGEYFNGTACVSCTTLGSEYTQSDGNRDSASACYKSCSKTCSGREACPANATCTYNENYSTTGTQHYNSTTCSATDPGVCPRTGFTCNACSKGTGAKTCTVTKGTNSCTYTGTCDTGYATPTASGSTVSCTTCADTYYYDNGTCTSCGTVSCPDRSSTESCTCSCSVANGTCTCANGQQTYTDSCLYTNGAGGTNGASACSGESYTRKTTGQCTGTNTITCNQNYYLNNNSCQSCPNAFPNTDASGKTSVTACYTNCVASDVTGAATVSGLKYSNAAGTGVGNKTCSALTCDSNHCLANGENGLKICVEKPEHGQCTNNPDNPIQCNTGYHLDNGDCVADTYTVTYSCGTGSGTKPANQTATYDASFTPRNNTCTKTDYVFAGWTVSGTNDVKDAGVAFTWKYTEAKTFTAKWVNTVCDAGDYFDAETATCTSCPDEFPNSARGSTDSSQCYKTCSAPCIDAGEPANVTPQYILDMIDDNLHNYQLCMSRVEGKQFNNGTDVCDTPTVYCDYSEVYCKSNYYQDLDSRVCEQIDGVEYCVWQYNKKDNICTPCNSLSTGSSPYTYPFSADAGVNGPKSCYAQVSLNCWDRLKPENHVQSCTYTNGFQSVTSITGGVYYPGTSPAEPLNGIECYVDNCTCEPGYEFVAPAALDATDPGACVPSTFTVTLNDNGGTGGSGTIYEKYSVGWYSDSAATTSITSVTKPTLDANHSFLGYFASPDADDTTPIIPASGALSNSTALTANAILYAHWSEDAVNCVAGKTAANATCPAGSYCPGGSVPASLKNDPVQGCARTCPSDVSGGTVTSPTGSSTIEACQTTRTGVELDDHTGGGDQICNYVDSETPSQRGYKNCGKVQIKYCNEGRYRVAPDAQSCNKVGTGYWSPAPTNTTEDNVSMVRYSCSVLPGYDNATTGGENAETSGLPTACYNTCSDQNVLDESNNIIGSRTANPRTVNFAGTITAYDYENATVTTSGSYPACTYDAPVCNDGYHTVGITCEPNIYTFTLNKDGGTGGDNGPIYMKYNTGWFSDSSATTPLTSITLPTQGSQNCTGYEVIIDGNQRSVINDSGVITASNKLVAYDDYTTPIELMASWIQKKTETCAAGEYYDYDTRSCTTCPAGSYCEGGTAYDDEDADGDDHFITPCPTAVAGTTYTPAQEWNGTALVDIAPNVTSDTGSSEASACYATVKLTATKGAGSRICHYASGKYESNCSNEQILTCDSGFYLDTTNPSDCTAVGYQYYSATYLTTRDRCPEAVYEYGDTRNTISTDGTESELVTSCVREGVWDETAHGGRTTRCHWNTSTDTYSTNCDSYTIRKCAAGYWDELEGETTSDETVDCVPVGFGYWSPAPENMDSTMTTDTVSTKRTRCLPGTGARDVVSTEPTTATETSADITACYLNCVPTKDLNGTEVSVMDPPMVHYNTTKNAYDTCIYDSDTCPKDMWCDENGFYDCPADKDGNPGKADLVSGQRNRGIDTCYVLYNPFVATTNYPNHIWNYGSGWVKAFFEGTEANGDYTNYFTAGALTCDAGYYYDSSIMCSGVNTCQYSPAQSAFAGETPTMEEPGSSTKPVACPAGCSGSEPYASSYTQCYKACDLGVSDFEHSKTVVPESTTVTGASATTYNECSYTLTCDTGYEPQNNGTATPSCQAKEYTITLNKNGGAGATPASVQCTFYSGACALPAIVDTRDGYSTANKWCTAADGTGTCYDAGTTVTTNISANASDITLFAQWTPNVYTITLNHNGAATAGAPSTVYLKYATGWYSDAAATTPITQLTTMPVKGVLTFAGYKGGDTTVIASDGKFVTSVAALTFTTANATVTAQWTDAPITCPAGTFYAGEGDDPTDPNVCKTCTENHYCPGTTVQTNSEESGQIVCPDNGKAPAGSDSVSDCYKENLPTYQADHGRGTQTCYYSETALSYSDRCKDFAIVTCDAGYWLDTTLVPLPTDCAPAGHGYYSADLELEHHACPNGGTTAENNETAESVYECYKTDLDYTPTDLSGSGKQSCWYSSGDGDSAIYERDCFDKVINKCRGGYYLANSTDIVCSKVGQNHYSGEDDIERHRCPDGGKTNSETAADKGLCYKDGLEYRAQHGGGSQTCNWGTSDPDTIPPSYSMTCGNKQITYCDGGYWLDLTQRSDDCVKVGYNAYSPDRDIAKHTCPSGTITLTETSASADDCFTCLADHVCNTVIGDKTCSELTGGEFTKSDAGTDDVAYCYAECEIVSPAAQMDGRNYNDAGNVQDTCEITQCEPGYYLQNGACVTCPANSYCDGINQEECPAPYTKSDAVTSDVDMCYKDCDVVSPATQMSGRDYNNAGSEPDTCQITQCEPGYYLQNGACVTCPANSYCDGINENACPAPYTKSDEGTADVSYCYKDCDLVPNAQAMVGRDYNGAPDTCEIVSCGEGYSLSNGQCVVCPAGSYCDGTPGDDGDGAKSCATLGDGSWKYSAPGATKASDCYRLCTEHTDGNCLLVPVDGKDKAYWANKCQYTATINGNPAEYDPETEMCTLTGCTTGFEMVNGICEPCNRENALSYLEGGNCTVESCAVGYHPKDDKCEADILDCTPQAPNATYAEQKWIATRGAYGICEIKSCEEDYHLASNACVANEQVCEVAHGVGIKTWNMDTKSWNPCEATSCVPGYTNDPYEKNDASEQCSECRNRYSVLGEVAATGYKTGCEIASCIYQGEKYNLENNECVPICSPNLCSAFDALSIQALTTGDYSDETGWMCWDDNAKKCRRTCNPGYMSW